MRSAIPLAVGLLISLIVPAPQALAQIDDTRLVICVDPLNMPYSETGGDPPGFDVEIGKALARETKRKFEIYWADTGTRGGLGRALRRSIGEKQCNAFMGLPTDPRMSEDLLEKDLALTRAYMSVGLVLVQPVGAKPIADFEDLGAVTTAVQLGTLPQQLLQQKQFKSNLFRTTELALAALAKGETQVALLFGPFVGWHIHEHYKDKLVVTTAFERRPDWHWDLAIAVRKTDTALKEALDKAIGTMLAENRIAPILEKYGVNFDAPKSN